MKYNLRLYKLGYKKLRRYLPFLSAIVFIILILFVNIVIISNGKKNSEPNIISIWNFEETSNVVEDTSVNQNDGFFFGVTRRVNGITGFAYDFDGVDDYVTIPFDNTLEPEILTISAWIYPGTSTLRYGVIIEKSYLSHTEPFYSFHIRLTYENGPKPTHLEWLGNTDGLFATLGVTTFTYTNSWHHIIASYDGTFARLYVDGELHSFQKRIGAIEYYATDVFIGKFQDLENGYFNGIIDEVKIYNTIINTETLITSISTTSGIESSLTSGESNSEDSSSQINGQFGSAASGFDLSLALITGTILALVQKRKREG